MRLSEAQFAALQRRAGQSLREVPQQWIFETLEEQFPNRRKSGPKLDVELEKEFLRIPDAVRFSGLSKTSLYNLIREGRLKSKLVRTPGNIRGIRLISRQAIRDFMATCEVERGAAA